MSFLFKNNNKKNPSGQKSDSWSWPWPIIHHPSAPTFHILAIMKPSQLFSLPRHFFYHLDKSYPLFSSSSKVTCPLALQKCNLFWRPTPSYFVFNPQDFAQTALPILCFYQLRAVSHLFSILSWLPHPISNGPFC